MKLLFVNQHYGMDGPATAVLLRQLAVELVGRGHQVSVVAGSDGGQWRGLIERSQDEGVEVRMVATVSIGGKSAPRRIVHYGFYFLLALWAGMRAERPDAVVTMSTPPMLAPLLGRFLGWYHGVEFFYNVQDLYPDVAIAAGKVPRSMRRALVALARRLERAAAGTSAVGRVMRRELERRRAAPVGYLPNWTDTDEIRPLPRESSFRGVWGLGDRFVVLYSGNLGVCHDLELIGDTIEFLRNQSIDFLFVVSPQSEANLRRRLGENPRVHYRAYQPREALATLLATCDAGLVTVAPGMSRYVVPCKTFGIMAAGKPVVAASNLDDDLYHVCRKDGAGLWARSADPMGLAQQILRLRNNPALCRTLGERGRRLAVERHSVRAAADAWETWLTGRDSEPMWGKEERKAA